LVGTGWADHLGVAGLVTGAGPGLAWTPGVAARGAPLPGEPVRHPSHLRAGVLHGQHVRDVPDRPVRAGAALPRRAPADDGALPARRVPLLLGGDRGRP